MLQGALLFFHLKGNPLGAGAQGQGMSFWEVQLVASRTLKMPCPRVTCPPGTREGTFSPRPDFHGQVTIATTTTTTTTTNFFLKKLKALYVNCCNVFSSDSY